ncbi:MAG: hypothetical protein R3F43_25570 [bacterium]
MLLAFSYQLTWASQDECTWLVECGCGPEYALAQQVRVRELTLTERTSVGACWLAAYEYLLGALEVTRSTPGASRSSLPAGGGPLQIVLNSLLSEVTAYGQPRTQWIDQTWAQYHLTTHLALYVWRLGDFHPRIAELAAADGYLPSDSTSCGMLCTYFRLVAAEPIPLTDKIIFHISREYREGTPGFVRLFELGPTGNDAAFQLYQQGWPGVAPARRVPLTNRLFHLLIQTGDARASQISPNDLGEQTRLVSPAQSGIPIGKRSLKKSLAYLLWQSYLLQAGPESARALRVSTPP